MNTAILNAALVEADLILQADFAQGFYFIRGDGEKKVPAEMLKEEEGVSIKSKQKYTKTLYGLRFMT